MFCAASELTPDLARYPSCVVGSMTEWKRHLQSQYPPRFPQRIGIDIRPDRRRWPTVPWEVEREIAALDVVEWCLNNPEYKRRWWDPLRSGRSPAGDVPSGITINYEHIRQQRGA